MINEKLNTKNVTTNINVLPISSSLAIGWKIYTEYHALKKTLIFLTSEMKKSIL